MTLPEVDTARNNGQQILAIDPGPVASGWCLLNPGSYRPALFGKSPNDEVLPLVDGFSGVFALEMVTSYGQRVGAEVFETVRWIGRFEQAAYDSHECDLGGRYSGPAEVRLIPRREVKVHHCGRSSADDAAVVAVMRDRFAPFTSNHGKGSKAQPGFFYGFKRDVWQAFALAVMVADMLN